MKRSLLIVLLTACGTPHAESDSSSSSGGVKSLSLDHAPVIKHVFVIAFENQDAETIYGNANAPFLNTLMQTYGYATHYGDDYQHPDLPSEPHYIQMEAGTNVFSDHTFTNDRDPSTGNSTASTQHLTNSTPSWMSYQEDMPDACPVNTSFPYAAKHNPFVFFRDVAFGADDRPDKDNAYCAAHHKDFASSFANDLKSNSIATYNFITPNTCNDMHGDPRCSNGCRLSVPGYGPCVSAGDSWLASNLPPLIAFAEQNNGVIFLVWDEAEDTSYAPFFVIGPHMRTPGAYSAAYGHASLLKSLQRIIGTPVTSEVASANDFADFFEPGYFP